MAKRYDNDFDAEAFVENFRAQDDSATPSAAPMRENKSQPSKSAKKDVSPKDSNAKPSDTAVGFIEKFLNNLKYKRPKNRYPQVGIHPKFCEQIEKMQKRNGRWGCSISTYVNTVLEDHFRENQPMIDDLTNNSYDYE